MFLRLCQVEHALLDYEGDHGFEALAVADAGEDERSVAALFTGVALHDLE